MANIAGELDTGPSFSRGGCRKPGVEPYELLLTIQLGAIGNRFRKQPVPLLDGVTVHTSSHQSLN